MQVRYLEIDPLTHDTPLLAVGVPVGTLEPTGFLERLDAHVGGSLRRVLEGGDLKGRPGDRVLLYASTSGGPARILLLGTGEPDALDGERVRRFLARTVRTAEGIGVSRIAAWLDGDGRVGDAALAQAAAEGAALAAWSFRELKTVEDEDVPSAAVEQVDLFAAGDADALRRGAEVGIVLAEAENLARTLQARPGNIATPSHLAEEARRVGGEAGFRVTVFDEDRMRVEGMNAILTVSSGSEEEARLIVMEYQGGEEDEAPLVLVGKGLTFDAGGISLKPASGMEEMKFDMSGGAAVIGAMKAVAELGVKANVVGIVPSSENLPSGTAVKPGDVVRTLAGKTVEIVNTDAEGRLILADALAYGTRLAPAAMVDCATLTGAVIVGLGHHASAVLGNDEPLVGELRAAGERSGERCWQLPLWKEYREQLKSETADLQNIGGRPGGTITAAAFLSEFVGDVPWAHLDVAGTAFGGEAKIPYQRKGGHGVPTRLLVEWVRGRAR
jgi:leucyl aminopeptidase